MTVREALQKRKSVRAYLEKKVERATITKILDSARHAPSGVNTQPWQVVVLQGSKKEALQHLIEQAFREGQPPRMEYQYYPKEWHGVYKKRRVACGMQLYSALGIARHEKERRKEQWAANFRAFDAPVMLLFFMDRELETGSYMDYGMFLQSLMLAAVEEGLATCPQASLGEFPAIVKEFLGYPDSVVLLGGMALGYEDPADPVNSYRTPRLAVSEFTTFLE